MFRMVPGVDVATADRGRRGPIGAIVRGAGSIFRPSGPSAPREVRPGETEMAQRSAAVVAATYRPRSTSTARPHAAGVLRRGRRLNADRFAWAVCDTIRTSRTWQARPGYCATGRWWRCRTTLPGSADRRVAAGSAAGEQQARPGAAQPLDARVEDVPADPCDLGDARRRSPDRAPSWHGTTSHPGSGRPTAAARARPPACRALRQARRRAAGRSGGRRPS